MFKLTNSIKALVAYNLLLIVSMKISHQSTRFILFSYLCILIYRSNFILMLNRRFLRVKVLQEIYACHQSEETDLNKAEKHLLENVDNLYQLFVYQLSFWVEVKRFAERRIEENRNKNFPTYEDLNPNMKFVNNRVLNMLDNNKHLLALEESYKINWADHREDFIRGFYNRLREYPEYQAYMALSEDSFDNDRKFLLSIVDKYMAEENSEDDENTSFLSDFYSDRNLSFNSDYQIAVFLLWKFLNEMQNDFNENTKLPPVYKTQGNMPNEDREFVIKLFRKTMSDAESFKKIVENNISNWDYDRLALMDRILIFMAMTEFAQFRDIPVKVTINEYIEISKYYSTPDSRRFINGVLDKVSQIMKDEGLLVKTGRGLI